MESFYRRERFTNFIALHCIVLYSVYLLSIRDTGWSITSQRSSVSAESDRCRCRCKFYKVKVDFRVPYYRVSCNCSTNPTCQSFVCEPEFDQLHRDIFTDNLADISASKHRATVVLERHRVGKALKKATGQGTGDGRSIGTTTVDVRTNSESPTTGLVSEELDKPLGQATYNRSARLPFVKQVMLSQCQCNCETSHGAGDFTSACYCYQSADSHGRCELRRWSCAKQTVKYTHGGKQFHQSFICYSAVNPLKPCTGVKWLHFIVFRATLV